jgi:hypothetical protein
MNQRHHARVHISRTIRALCVSFVMAAIAATVAASSPDENREPRRNAPEASSAATGETEVMKVFVDRETGEIISVPLRETDVLSAPLTKALTRSTEGLQVFELANGGRGVHLDGRFQHVLMVRVRPDGSFETVCTNSSHAAEKFLHGEPAGADAEPRDK